VTRSRWVVDVRALLTDGAALDDVESIILETRLAESLAPLPYREVSAAECDAENYRATVEAIAMKRREQRGESTRPEFRGVRQALQAVIDTRLDGAPLRSCWKIGDDATGGCVSTTAVGDAGQRAAERVVFVERDWALVFASGWCATIATSTLELTGDQARRVVLWAVFGIEGDFAPLQSHTAIKGRNEGGGVWDPTRQKPAARVSVRGRPAREAGDMFKPYDLPGLEQVAAHASRVFGRHVSEPHVAELQSSGLREMFARLHSRGLVPLDRRYTTMSHGPLTDLFGWKAIADYARVSHRTAIRLADREVDPLPVRKRRHTSTVEAVRAEIDAWRMADTVPRARVVLSAK